MGEWLGYRMGGSSNSYNSYQLWQISGEIIETLQDRKLLREYLGEDVVVECQESDQFLVSVESPTYWQDRSRSRFPFDRLI
jgi:hypothetical protein